jgi:hypothetical protein
MLKAVELLNKYKLNPLYTIGCRSKLTNHLTLYLANM